jgi:hypothetical protein
MRLTRNTMLVFTLLLLLGGVGARAAAEGPERPRESLAGGVDRNLVTTGILYDQVAPLSGIDALDGSLGSPPVQLKQWRQVYYEIYRAAIDAPTWPEIGAVREMAERATAGGVIPIAIMDFRYNRIAPEGLEEESSTYHTQAPLGVGADKILTERVFTAAALKAYTYRGADVEFALDAGFYFTNSPVPPTAVQIDFSDGLGLRTIAMDRHYRTSYEAPGMKRIRVRAEYADGSVRYATFLFEVRQLETPAPDDTLFLTASIPYLGEYGTGEAYVYYGESHATLTNPVLVIEGFDLDNTMNWEELYQSLNQEGLIETLRTQGYDAVVLNFTEATDYIQRNAFVVVELIQEVNSRIDPGTDLVVIGASMGGLCGRYALTYMEDNDLEHNTRTYISFDSPHKGANIPLGIQYWVKLFSIESEDAAFLLERLSTPAARQMLVYFYTDPPGATGESDPLFGQFQTDLASIGSFPTDLRKVAVANGSGYMADQGFDPAEQIIQYEYNSFLVDIVGNVWAVPDNTYHIIFDGLINRICPFPDDALVAYVDGTKPYDSAPGGYRSTMAQMDNTEAPYGDIIALYDNHCFVPTISSLDLDTDDLFYDIAGDPDLMTHTPFDTVYYPAANQEHISITAESKTWFIDEIGRGALSGVRASGASVTGTMLERSRPNPFHRLAELRFHIPAAQHVEIDVFDVKGRKVAVLTDGRAAPGWDHITWDGKDSFGRAVASGVYFCVLTTPQGSRSQPMVLLK